MRLESGKEAARAVTQAGQVLGSQQLFPGDLVAFTAGAEHYALDEGDVTVGPCTVTTVVGPGERVEDAFARASVAASTMLEAEYRQKIKSFKKRSVEARQL